MCCGNGRSPPAPLPPSLLQRVCPQLWLELAKPAAAWLLPVTVLWLMEELLRWRRRRRTCGGGCRQQQRLSGPLGSRKGELAVPRRRGLGSPKVTCCLLQADGSGLHGLSGAKKRQREDEKGERDRVQIKEGEILRKMPLGKEHPYTHTHTHEDVNTQHKCLKANFSRSLWESMSCCVLIPSRAADHRQQRSFPLWRPGSRRKGYRLPEPN